MPSSISSATRGAKSLKSGRNTGVPYPLVCVGVTMMTPTAAVSRRPRKRRAAEAVTEPVRVTEDWSSLDPNDLSSPALYINRELSWLAFNERVLAQAQDGSHPLLERVKFLAI